MPKSTKKSKCAKFIKVLYSMTKVKFLFNSEPRISFKMEL